MLFLFFSLSLQGNQVTVVGCGHVGLTLAAVLSHGGHTIICVDIDKETIAELNNQKLHIYEPQLQDLLFDASRRGKVVFVDDVRRAMDSEIFYICVATPIASDGTCDCSALYSVFHDVVRECSDTNALKIICVKSTVPPGTMRALHDYLVKEKKHNIHLVYNPEFMREGSAIDDTYTSNPIVLAGESLDALQRIEDMYNNFLNHTVKVIKTNFETAEIIKYAWNSFSAMRVAYVNELALLCRECNADISTVVQGLALSEELLPTGTIKPGPGYGGSCLPKDASSFSKVLEENGFSFSVIHRVIRSNKNHIDRVIQDVLALLEVSEGQKIVTLLGLSFKAHTNDIRNAPSVDIIKALIEKGIIVKAYDPQAISDMKKLFPHIQYFDSPYEAIKDTDCIVALTEWEEIKKIDFDKVALLCNKRVIVDTRNMYNVEVLRKHNFTYLNMGRTR